MNIPPHVKHWHGATKDSWLVHVTITLGETDLFMMNGMIHDKTNASSQLIRCVFYMSGRTEFNT